MNCLCKLLKIKGAIKIGSWPRRPVAVSGFVPMNGEGRACSPLRAANVQRTAPVPRRRARSDAPYLAKRRGKFIGLMPLRSGAWILLTSAATRCGILFEGLSGKFPVI